MKNRVLSFLVSAVVLASLGIGCFASGSIEGSKTNSQNSNALITDWCWSLFGGEVPGLCESTWKGAYFQFNGDIRDPQSQWNSYQIEQPYVIRHGDGRTPWPQGFAENFSTRWTRAVYLPSGTYRFIAPADDGIRVVLREIETVQENGILHPADGNIAADGYAGGLGLNPPRPCAAGSTTCLDFTVPGDLLINAWQEQGFPAQPYPGWFVSDRTIAGGFYLIVVEYYQRYGGSAVEFDLALTDGGIVVDPVCASTDWAVEYYGNRDWSGDSKKGCVAGPNPRVLWNGDGSIYNYAVALSALPEGVGREYFSAKLKRKFKAGLYNIQVREDDVLYITVTDPGDSGKTTAIYSRYVPTGPSPDLMFGLQFAEGAMVELVYRQETLDAYLDVMFEKLLQDGKAELIVDCPVPWQPQRANYYKVIRINQDGSRQEITNANQTGGVWTALDSNTFAIPVPIQAALSLTGQMFEIELWVNNEKFSTITVVAKAEEKEKASGFCTAFPSAGVCNNVNYNWDQFCQRARASETREGKTVNRFPPEGLDQNICHMASCLVPETTPGGVCDPAGDGMGANGNDIDWINGWYSFRYWAKEKCHVEYP